MAIMAEDPVVYSPDYMSTKAADVEFFNKQLPQSVFVGSLPIVYQTVTD
jgi:hypothetical protein